MASQAWSQLNEIASVTDPKGVATQYTRNAFGEVLAETSPDSGTTTYTRDAGGYIASKTDARVQTTTYTRDALGRATLVSFTDGKTHQFSYDNVGNISQFTDPSGTTSYTRNVLGQVLSTLQTVADSPTVPSSYTTAYLYHPGGQVAQINYPSGLKVFYRKNAVGQISSVDTQLPGTTVPKVFLANIQYNGLGQPKAWDWRHCVSAQLANCVKAARTYDSDGRMTSNEFASYNYDAAGRITALTQQMAAKRSVVNPATGATSTQYFNTPLNFLISYDNRNRISSFNRSGNAQLLSYDSNGNRLSLQSQSTADTDLDNDQDTQDITTLTAQTISLAPGSNRLLGFAQTITRKQGAATLSNTATTVNFAVDAAGNMSSDGRRAFVYDAQNRHAQATVSDSDEGSKVTFLHNALGQRVFKSEPQVDHVAPNATMLGSSFVSWLLANFNWMFATAQANATLGQSFVYAEPAVGVAALLGEYGNGGVSSTGRREYLWLPVGEGMGDGETNAIPIGLYRDAALFAVHSDHLATPRRVTERATWPSGSGPTARLAIRPPRVCWPRRVRPRPSLRLTRLRKPTPPRGW